MSSDDEFFDDDEDFIALTLKPPKLATQAQPNTQHVPQQIQNQPPTFTQQSQNVSSDILIAKGEIAVLRAKIQELEKQKQHEREQLLQNRNVEKENNEIKIKTLENAVQRLEDERKFLSVEVRNLSNSRKKRKISDEKGDGGGDIDMDRPSTPSVPNTAITTPSTNSTEPIIPKFKQNTVKLAPPKTINENSLFIENVLNHTIIGCDKTTMEMLSHITINIPFRNDEDEIFNIKTNIPLSTTILEYLVSKQDVLRLDMLITKFSQNLTLLIQHIFDSNEISNFAIPYLISILHSIILFRPSAITSDTSLNLSVFITDLIIHHTYLIKKQDEISIGQRRFQIPAIQKKIIDSLILIFSIELLESILINCGNDKNLIGKILNEIQSQLNIICKLGLSSNSCLIIIFPLVEILNVLGHYDGFPEEIILLLSQILNNGIQPKEDMSFQGMNRIIGDFESIKLISGLINWEKSHDDLPKVIYSIESSNDEYEFHLITLQLKICGLFEKLIMDNFQEGIELFTKDSNILKLLISSISKQQEFSFKSPRNSISHYRTKLISSIIQLIHLIWELNFMNYKTTSRITKDSTHELIITLSRIAFSANITSNEATEFLYQLRKIDKDFVGFNKWSELRAREISHINYVDYNNNNYNSKNTDSKNNTLESINNIINAETGYSNGLEFAFDDIVVELSRDILEKCTTMDEADNLYLSMNA